MANWQAFNMNLKDIGSSLGQYAKQENEKKAAWDIYQKQKDMEFQNAIALEREKLKIQQEDPMYQILKRGELASKLKSIADMGGDVSGYRAMFGIPSAGQGGMTPSGQTGVYSVPVSAPVMPVGGTGSDLYASEGYELLPFGGFRPKGLKSRKEEAETSRLKVEETKKTKQVEEEVKNSFENEKKVKLIKDSAQDTLDTIAKVEKGIKEFGLWGQMPSIPGSQRTIWESNVNKLLAGKVIDIMMAMKDASKTGATGFGALNQTELDVLKESSTALKRWLPPSEAQKILNDMKLKLSKILNGSDVQQETNTQSQYQVGQTIVKDGITYTFNGKDWDY